MRDIAVEGCELEPVSTTQTPATGNISITSVASTEVTVNGKGVYFKEIRFSVTNSNGSGSVTNNDGTGEGVIMASGSSMVELPSEYKAVLEGDESAEVQINGHSGQYEATGYIKVRVKKAGQTDTSLDD